MSYVGDKESRSVIRDHELSFEEGAVRKSDKASKIRSSTVKFHVLLTSYECISIDAACLGSVQWEVLVVDEAHRFRNNKSTQATNLVNAARKAKQVVMLTGTPITSLGIK